MADLDSALKRGSGIHPSSPWRGLYPFPDGTIGQPDRQVAAWLYSGISSGAPATTAAVTGTATASITEADIVAGGKTIIITLANDTWVAAGAAFNAQRQAIINGLDAASSPALGWNDEVRDKEVVGSVVRDSDTQVTVTLTASALYDIAATETITITVPSAALVTSLVDVTATPTFDVSFVAPAVTTTTPGGVRKGRKRDVVIRLSDVQNRADTAEFLKSQLKLRHPASAFEEPAPKPKLSKAERAQQAKVKADALKAMQIEAENEQRRILDAQNNDILKLILLASL